MRKKTAQYLRIFVAELMVKALNTPRKPRYHLKRKGSGEMKYWNGSKVGQCAGLKIQR